MKPVALLKLLDSQSLHYYIKGNSVLKACWISMPCICLGWRGGDQSRERSKETLLRLGLAASACSDCSCLQNDSMTLWFVFSRCIMNTYIFVIA